MKYVDINLNEIDPATCDQEKGFFQPYFKKVATHPATPFIPEQGYYQVKDIKFTNGDVIYDIDPADKRLEALDPERGSYRYIDDQERVVKEMSLKWIVTVPAQEPVQEWEEHEEYMQWIEYTEEELENMRLMREAQQRQQDFLQNGADKIDELNVSVDDLVLTVADLIAG